MAKEFYYLAGPHKGTPEQEAYRFKTSLEITSTFLTQGVYVFSPIVYATPLAESLHFSSLEERRQLLMSYLLSFLKVSKGMVLVTMGGWQESWGVNQELRFCQGNQIPVYLMSPDHTGPDFSDIFLHPLDQKTLNELLLAA